MLVWSERYGVSIGYIIEALLTYYYHNLPKHSRDKANRSRGLGIRIATLVGDVSLSILHSHLANDFPDGNNLAAFKEEEKERIVDILDDSMPRKARSVLQYESMDRFVKAYERSIVAKRSNVSRLAHKMCKIKWRGNPWL